MALSSNSILDAVTLREHDNTSTMRARILSWFNDAVQAVWLARDWKFLKVTDSTIPLVDSQIALPADYGRLLSLSVQQLWFLDQRNQFTDEEEFLNSIESLDGIYPNGWTENLTHITLRPRITGTPKFIYMPTIPEYLDNQITVFPIRFRMLFVRTLMSAYYEFEADNRGMVSIQLDQVELDKLHKWENKNNPQTVNTKYVRDYSRGHNFSGIEVL